MPVDTQSDNKLIDRYHLTKKIAKCTYRIIYILEPRNFVLQRRKKEGGKAHLVYQTFTKIIFVNHVANGLLGFIKI